MNGNRVTAIEKDAVQQVSRFTDDTTHPVLTAFSLNLTSEELVLTFDETVNGSTLTPHLITMLSPDGDFVYRLTGGSAADLSSTVSTLQLSVADLNYLKSISDVAVSNATTLLALEYGAVVDMAGNVVQSMPLDSPLQAAVFYPDTIQPELLSFDLDMDVGQLSLVFDETVQPMSTTLRLLVLQQSANGTTDGSIRLTGGLVHYEPSTVINVTVADADLNILKQVRTIWISALNTYLAGDAGMIDDMAGNPVKAVSTSHATAVTNYVNDTTGPALIAYVLDMNNGLVSLTFSETVLFGSVSPLAMTFLSKPNASAANSFKLTGGIVSVSSSLNNPLMGVNSYVNENDSTSVDVLLTPEDLNELKRIESLTTNRSTSYVSLTSAFVADMRENLVDEISRTSPLQAARFVNDSTAPHLDSFELDMNSTRLTLSFSETVDISSLLISGIVLQDERKSGTSYTLSNESYSVGGDSPVIVVELSGTDANELKRRTDICTNVNNTFLALLQGTLVDMSGNEVVPVSSSNALQVGLFTPDATPPRVTSFSLDMDSGFLTVGFSETVNASSLLVDNLQIQSEEALNNTVQFHGLTAVSGTQTTSLDGTVLQIKVSRDDLNRIKQLRQLATLTNNTFLSVIAGAVKDMNGLEVEPISAGSARSVREFIVDQSEPNLISFSLNLTSEVLTLTFDETIEVDSLDMSKFDLLNGQDSPFFVNLTDGETLSQEDTDTVSVKLVTDDLNNLKLDMTLGTSVNNTWLSMERLAVKDLAYNQNGALPVTLQASVFVEDTVSPELVSFTVNMNDGTVSLIFNEPVAANSFVFRELTLQAAPDSTIYHVLSGGATMSTNGLTYTVILTRDDLNEVKKITELATSRNSSYVSFTSLLVRDIAGNPVTAVLNETAQQAAVFYNDSTKPRIVRYDLDMNNGYVTLHFMETIDVSSLDFKAVTLQTAFNVSRESQQYTLTNGSLLDVEDSTRLMFAMTENDVNEIKLKEIARNNRTAYLVVTEGVVSDMNGQPLQPLENGLSALSVSTYTPDTTPPTLELFSLNLTSQQLIISFTETVRSHSVIVSRLGLQAHANFSGNTERFTLSNSSFIESGDGTAVVVHLGVSDFNAIKRLTGLAVSRETTYLTIAMGALLDMVGNPVTAVSKEDGASAFEFTPDVIRPSLESFILDMNSPSLTLSFSETVNVSSIALNEFTLQQGLSDLGSEVYSFTGGAVSDGNDAVLVVQITSFDFNEIKKLTSLATNRSSTYLSVTWRAVLDMDDNYVNEISSASAVQAKTYIPDVTPPQVTFLELDLDTGTITLNFSETVNTTSVQLTSLSVRNNRSNATSRYSLTGGSFAARGPGLASTFGSSLRVVITETDLNNIKAIENLAVSNETSFISIDSLFVTDMDDNAVVPLPADDALQVSEFRDDVSPPELRSYDLDMTSVTLTLTFSETVNYSSLQISEISLQNTMLAANTTSVFRLTEYKAVTADNAIVTVRLSDSDSNTVKAITSLATSSADTYLTMSSQAIQDMRGNFVSAVFNRSAQQVANFTEDLSSPVLISFNLNMTSEQLVLEFSETVAAVSLNPSLLALKDMRNGTQYNLTGGTILNVVNETTVTLQLTRKDVNNLQARVGLADSMETTFLALTSNAIKDMNLNRILPVSGLLVTTFVEDKVRPTLTDFDLDLNGGTLTLSFSETVNTYSLNVGELLLQSVASDATVSHRLSNARGTLSRSSNSSIVVVSFGTDDLNELKKLDSLVTSVNNTYISFGELAIVDMNGNRIVQVSNSSAKQAVQFREDRIRPSLDSFELDMDEGTLRLSFSETVNASSFSAKFITVQASNDSDRIAVNVMGRQQPAEHDYLVNLFLSEESLNEMKRIPQLATIPANTFLSLTNETVRDMNGNAVIAVEVEAAVSVGFYESDTSSPSLRSFDLDLNQGLLILTFAETVNSSSLSITDLLIHNFAVGSADFEVYRLTSVSTTSLFDSPVLSIPISAADLNEIKRRPALAVKLDGSDTYLAFNSTFIRDMNGNAIEAVAISNGTRVSRIVRDVTCPMLTAFSLDLNYGIIDLTFSETVNSSSLDAGRIRIQGTSDLSPLDHYYLTTTFTPSSDGTEVRLSVTPVDLNQIKAMSSVATSETDSWIYLSESAIKDMSWNGYCNTTVPKQVSSGNFTPDSSSPSLVSYSLDMDSGEIAMTFTEAVVLGNITKLTLHGSSLADGNVTLTGSIPETIPVNATAPTVVKFILTHDDLNSVKAAERIATSVHDTYVSFSSPAFIDVSGNPVISVNASSAKAVAFYVRDTTPPVLTSFSLDMNEGLLELQISETVNTTSVVVSEFFLQNGTSSMDVVSAYQLQQAVVSQRENGVILLQLSDVDVNEIKRTTSLASGEATTYLYMSSTALKDAAGLFVEAVDSSAARKVELYVRDITKPRLLSFSLNLTAVTLSFSFDETIDASSLEVAKIALVSDSGDANRYPLTGGNVSTEDSTVVVVQLRKRDLDKIKLNEGLAISLNTTCLSLTAGFVADLSSPSLSADSTVLCASSYADDAISPRLATFAFDIDSGILTLNFDEPILRSSVDFTQLTLQATTSVNDSIDLEHRLTGGFSDSGNGLRLKVNITKEDLDEIKRKSLLASGAGNTYIRVTSDFISDMNNNSISSVPASNGIGVSSFIGDTSRPTLTSFDLDMDTSLLTLHFDETVDVSTVIVSDMVLQSDSRVDEELDRVSLRGILNRTVDDLSVYIILSLGTMNELKMKRVGRNVTSSWLLLSNTALKDMADQPVVAIVNGINSELVSRYTPDTAAPQLVSFSLDLTSETITLSFTETIDLRTVDTTLITLTDGSAVPNANVMFTFSNVSEVDELGDAPTVVIQIGSTDLNRLKELTELGTNSNNSYLSVLKGAVSDVFTNPVEETRDVPVDTFTGDNTHPDLLGFDFDLDSGEMTLTFSETVRASSLDTSGITIASSKNTSDAVYQSYTLSGAHQKVSADSTVLKIELTTEDLNNIKFFRGLATSSESTYISVDSTAVTDMYSNTVSAIGLSSARRVNLYVADKTPPLLTLWEIDMDAGELKLSFDETVRNSSLALSKISLRDNSTYVSDEYALTGGMSLSPDSSQLLIQLSDDDLNEIKRLDLCTRGEDGEDCYIILDDSAVEGMAGNSISGCTAARNNNDGE